MTEFDDPVVLSTSFTCCTPLPVFITLQWYSAADQRKHQSSASLAFVRGIHRWPVNSPHKWPVTRKMFPFDDVIMNQKYIPIIMRTVSALLFSVVVWYWSTLPVSFMFAWLAMVTSSKVTFSALLALCVGNSPVTGDFPTQRPVTRRFNASFELRLNKRLSKQSWGWWFETPSRSLWRHHSASRQSYDCSRASDEILTNMDQ